MCPIHQVLRRPIDTVDLEPALLSKWTRMVEVSGVGTTGSAIRTNSIMGALRSDWSHLVLLWLDVLGHVFMSSCCLCRSYGPCTPRGSLRSSQCLWKRRYPPRPPSSLAVACTPSRPAPLAAALPSRSRCPPLPLEQGLEQALAPAQGLVQGLEPSAPRPLATSQRRGPRPVPLGWCRQAIRGPPCLPGPQPPTVRLCSCKPWTCSAS